ncbi:LysM peptidoglycan-binding domain-containing protein [Flavobacterium sp. F-380]|uniref:LysM peptidoglycan-binding domain-containing protein n=1 Tax=Flavobacterium kayseriense TaxID=2764714 RepID=A0ABR7J769_9FLAO|nr:GDSL-type esterase/lipase family protein [Flavobacterium kayseriense]MBC5841360.1 LysM peptidoglycan-binding domain-containing protein [Flavobacterium kayseriense]MBC5847888.1 LysM peptidoglycan-binding domain-containing protein [Flavobacterium kayseriense]MBU0940711.1 LysM peptidoglycan-binding domain-containing protein [Bacteroidota bacterium]
MGYKLYVLVLLGLMPFKGCSQTNDTAETMDVIATTETIPVSESNFDKIENANELASFFAKLKKLKNDKRGKINIVHIGDSHIQAGIMTAEIRKNLQSYFGNGGRGFIFPHNLAKTNGDADFKFSSNVLWKSYRNIYPEKGDEIGLSGILFSTKSKKLVLQLNAKEVSNAFNTIKIFTPGNRNLFEVATSKQQVVVKAAAPKVILHKIKKGETISEIAEKYSLSISQVKRANGLKSDRITFGKTLKIPTKETTSVDKTIYSFMSLPLLSTKNFHYYQTADALKTIYLLPNKEEQDYVLSGIILENDKPGILYHNLGVNGAKFSDYNKYPLFFDQLKGLQPDLIVVSFGTNESYGKLSNAEFMQQLELFAQNIKRTNPNSPILVLTPPPSFLANHKLNTIVDGYCKEMSKAAIKNQYAFYNFYSLLGGMNGVEQNFRSGIIAADRVHYTVKGYQLQGKLVSDEIIQSFHNYNK